MTERPANLPVPIHASGEGGSKAAVRAYLAKNVNHLAGLLPAGMNEQRVARIAMECFREIPKLGNCSPQSLIGGILASAQIGLKLGKAAGGYCYLIPFKGEATLVIGVPGRIQLAYQSGFIKAARCGVAYDDQQFEIDEISGTTKLSMKDPERNYDNEKAAWFWAVAETSAGGTVVDYMNRPTIESRRQKLQSRNSPAWRDWFDEMGMNMVFRHLLKRVPKSAAQDRAEAIDTRVVRHGEGRLVAEWVDTPGGDTIDVTPDPSAAPSETRVATRVEVFIEENNLRGDSVTHAFREADLIGSTERWANIPDSSNWDDVKAILKRCEAV